MSRKPKITKDFQKGYLKGMDDLAKLLCIERRLSRTDWFKDIKEWKKEEGREIPEPKLKDKVTLYSEIDDIFLKQKMTMDFLSSTHGLKDYRSKINIERFIKIRSVFTQLFPPDEK